MRNQAHLAETQSPREKRDGGTKGMRGEGVVKKIGNNSRKIIRKQRPYERGQKLHSTGGTTIPKLPDECLRYLIRCKMRTPTTYTLENAVSEPVRFSNFIRP